MTEGFKGPHIQVFNIGFQPLSSGLSSLGFSPISLRGTGEKCKYTSFPFALPEAKGVLLNSSPVFSARKYRGGGR